MANSPSTPDYAITVIPHVWIPVRDGTRLSATLIKPLATDRFPVIFRCDGYRKDLTRKGEVRRIGEWFAARGSVYVLMDIRGTGDSEGVAEDEYTQQELEDAYDAIEWLADQEWCNGSVGMWGKSYSGFNSIMTAMLRPPHLKAILPIYATDDRYTDDMHYWGGNRLVGETIPYPIKMIYTNLMPPTPSVVGNRWKEMWKDRVEGSPPWFLEWWRQQTDGPYWRHGSLRGRYQEIDIPVFMIGGWKDGYTDSIPRMMAHLKSPCKALIGPWGHQLPHISSIKPRADFLTMKLRWWDHWLKGIDTGLMEEPPILFYMHDYNPPGAVEHVAGEWRTLDRWPDASSPEAQLFLAPAGELSPNKFLDPSLDTLHWSLKLGIGEWKWCLHSPETMSVDQRSAEPYSLVYSSAPLTETVEILGQPHVNMTVSATQPDAQIFVRICDVAPDGSSTLVAWGALNLTHHNGHTNPVPLKPGQPYRVRVDFSGAAWKFRPGHRIRLVVSTHDWPRTWPAPQPFDLNIHHDPENPGSLHLPIAPPAQIAPDLDPPVRLSELNSVEAKVRPFQWEIIQHRPAGVLRFVLKTDENLKLVKGTLEESTFRCVEISVSEDDPLSNELRGEAISTIGWLELTAAVEVLLKVTCTQTTFQFDLDVTVTADGEIFCQRQWRETIPRQGV